MGVGFKVWLAPPFPGPPFPGTPFHRTAQNFARFFSLWGVFSSNFGGVFEGRNPQICTFGLSGCRVKPATKIPREHTQRDTKRAKRCREREKTRNFGRTGGCLFFCVFFFHLVVLLFDRKSQKTETLKLAKVGLAKVGQLKLAKVGLANVGISLGPPTLHGLPQMDWPKLDWTKLAKSGRPKRDWPNLVSSVSGLWAVQRFSNVFAGFQRCFIFSERGGSPKINKVVKRQHFLKEEELPKSKKKNSKGKAALLENN